MKRFGPLDSTALRDVLRQAAADRMTGSILVAGRGDGGQIWLREGQVCYAQTDTQPRLTDVLVAVGAATTEQLDALAGSSDAIPALRDGITPAIAGVTVELTDGAISRLLDLTGGSWRSRFGDAPPLGALVVRKVDEVFASVDARARILAVRDLTVRGQWRPVADAGRTKLRPQDWTIVAAMARPASPAELSHRTGLEIADVRDLLSDLARRGLIERAGLPEQDTPLRRTVVEPVPDEADATAEAATTPTDDAVAAPAPVDRTVDAPAEPRPEVPVPPRGEESQLDALERVAAMRAASAHQVARPTTPPAAPRPTLDSVREPVPIGASVTAGGGFVDGGGGGSRATALRRLIGAVRRL